ncbi:MAG: LytTR family transcriptional regulator DNA-binding domain-containing protein [Oscillospiraceae bacterium]|nr:LytTR family transcriptional regulator DNA-binding domain-containing protein [Oscillospiraceae bacterium]
MYRNVSEYHKMDVKISRIPEEEEELVDIRCHSETDSVREIAAFVRSRQGQLSGSLEGRQYGIALSDIMYIESVDSRTFIYTSSKVFESRQRIYELEDSLRSRHFLRISKASLVNLMKISSVKPALGGRFSAVLSNGEEIIISRKYVPVLKKTLRGDIE